MEQKRFDQFSLLFLVNASQMAYLEEAFETQAMLQKFIEVFRYFNRPDIHINLSDEIGALKNYIDLQTIRYGKRFEIDFKNCSFADDTSIGHLEVIDFFDNIFNNALIQYENMISFSIEIVFDQHINLKVLLKSDSEIEEFNLTLAEEVDNGA